MVLTGSLLGAVLAAASGFFLRRLLAVGPDRLTAADPMLGFAAATLIMLWGFRLTGSLAAAALFGGAALVLCALGLAASRRRIIIERPGAAAAVAATFIAAVASVYLPMIFHAGTAYAPPPVFDLPKQLFALTALAQSLTWPPANPFFPDGVFAYNYLFYLPIAAAMRIAGEPLIAFIAFPVLAIAVTALTLWHIVDVAERVGVRSDARWIVMLLATWVGGLTPLLVGTPALGFLLRVQGWTGYSMVFDEPFISAVFVPQHIFAVASILCTIWLMAQSGELGRRLTCASIVAASGALSSLILLPHVSLAFAIAALVAAVAAPPRRRMMKLTAAGMAYSALILPFLLEAREWQGGRTGQLLGLLPIDSSIWVWVAACGPVLPLFIVGAWVRIVDGDRDKGAAITIILVAIVALLMGLFARYSDVHTKSTMLLRMLLPPLATLGLMALWSRLPTLLRGALAALVAGVISINAPTAWWYAVRSWSPLSAADRAFIEAMRRQSGRLLVEYDDQWIAALAARPLLMDFRPVRTDAYLPAAQRAQYGVFFDALANEELGTTSQALRLVTGVVATSKRKAIWEPLLGRPKASGFNHFYFEIRR